VQAADRPAGSPNMAWQLTAPMDDQIVGKTGSTGDNNGYRYIVGACWAMQACDQQVTAWL